MADPTFVLVLAEEAGKRLYEDLGRANYVFRTVPYARFSAQGEETTATWYASGKLVVQGRGAASFVEHRLPGVGGAGGGAAGAPGAAGAASGDPRGREWDLRAPEAGSDESGKGDYFGPLSVVAAVVQPEDVPFLRELRVQDSKAASDGHVVRVEGLLLGRLATAERVLAPEAYNQAWSQCGNVNVLLGRLHAEVLDEAISKASGAGRARIVVDRFGDPQHVRRHLSPEARAHPFVMPTHGERHPAVAAASFLARAAFLRGFEELRNLAGGELYRGSSDPRILQVARRLDREGGRAWLAKFAKLHFRTTLRL